MKSLREVMREADELEARRQHQIQNQINSINRLLEGSTYDDEMRTLHEELASTQAELDKAQAEIRRLKG